jgi:F-type H+-transporting ATPase subunit alpha
VKAMRQVAGRLKLDLAQYRELEAFSQFGSELDAATQRTRARGARNVATQNALNRGEKMVSTLNQPQYQPWPVEEQVVAIFAGINGYLDDVPTSEVPRFQDELREQLKAEGSIYAEIREQKELTDELTEKLQAELKKFKNGFNVGAE